MIAFLTGQILLIGDDYLILDVNGVGYEIFASGRSLMRAGGVGDTTRFHIYTHVRDDTLQLFGFIDTAEKAWFNHLTSVQGVGAKMALTLLSTIPPEDLVQIITAEDDKALTQAKGIGKKLAGRLVQELKDKVDKIVLDITPMPGEISSPLTSKKQTESGHTDPVSAQSAQTKSDKTPDNDQAEKAGNTDQTAVRDAVSALVNLGYGRTEAFQAVQKSIQNDNAANDLPLIIQLSLKELNA